MALLKASSHGEEASAEHVTTDGLPRRVHLYVQSVREFGDRWLDQHRSIVASLPIGAVLAVDMDSSRHVVAVSGLAAMDLFEATFGLNAVAWVHEVGVPISLGGGLWQLRSGV